MSSLLWNSILSTSSILTTSYLFNKSSFLQTYNKHFAFGTCLLGGYLTIKYNDNSYVKNILFSSLGMIVKINKNIFIPCVGSVLILNNFNKSKKITTNYNILLQSVFVSLYAYLKYYKIVNNTYLNIIGGIITIKNVLGYSNNSNIVKNYLNPIFSFYLYLFTM